MKNKTKKIILIVSISIVLTIIIYFFYINSYKTIKTGNNINKSAEEIKNYILSISSYELTAEITINSNKNQNKYVVKQKYEENEHSFKQEVLEPENIKGMITVYDGKKLIIENKNLTLNHLYDNYSWIGDNNLCLNSFIDDYKNSDNSNIKEENEVVELTAKKGKYTKKLFVNKRNSLPFKLVIQDSNKNILVYIEYREINLNEISKEEILNI